jgi:hypothetical protein
MSYPRHPLKEHNKKNPEKQEKNSKKRYLVVVVVVCEDMAVKDKVCWARAENEIVKFRER